MKVLGMGLGVVGPSRNLTFNCIPLPLSPPLSLFEVGRPKFARTCFEVNFKSVEQFIELLFLSFPGIFSSLLFASFSPPFFFFQIIGAAASDAHASLSE